MLINEKNININVIDLRGECVLHKACLWQREDIDSLEVLTVYHSHIHKSRSKKNKFCMI